MNELLISFDLIAAYARRICGRKTHAMAALTPGKTGQKSANIDGCPKLKK